MSIAVSDQCIAVFSTDMPQPCQSLFVAPCSHVWHYKCIRPILNDHKVWPQFLCPNCRAVTDLEADVDDPANEEWEDDEVDAGSIPDIKPIASIGDINGSIPEDEEMSISGDGEALSSTTSRLLSIHDENSLPPDLTASAVSLNSHETSPSLLLRRGASRIAPPFVPAMESPAPRTPSGQIEYLRPITPTQPLMSDGDLKESSMGTPTTDMLANEGPMTPTNNAGPFVFDGSAGRMRGSGFETSLSEASADA